MQNFSKVEFLDEATEFVDGLDEKSRDKLLYVIRKAQLVKDKELFKPLEDQIWEFRSIYSKKKFRLYAFWDKTDKIETLVIATHGTIKKTQRTPKKEINKAKKLRAAYFNSKKEK
jgi:phage-related protein